MAKSNVGKKPISEEEYTTNKVLTVFSVCLLGVLVLMVVQRLLDYTNTWSTGMLVSRILLGIGVLGLICGVVLLAREIAGKRQAVRRILCGRNVLIASIVLVLAMAAVLYLGTGPIKVLYVVLPVLAVYYLVYHSYAKEFFLIAVDTGVGIGLMWLIHRALDTTNYVWVAYASLIAAIVLTVAQLIAVGILRGKNGKIMYRGKKKDMQFSRNAYTMLTITPVLMAVLVAAVLFAPTHILIAMGVAAAYLFITAVYYTVKLM
ncbi:hypothetical protein [Agathobaculum sp. Marseille-P7918]|uniref:hypothetical protein n=1 Tax=Agathobaculum sp. Marseille-P7918 TaxID=2479843 RepID=UPI000F63AA21|nr:hypothetical protein [Agathobaculum sp. Marseille-P7918]